MNEKELMIEENRNISIDEKKFIELHKEILYFGNMSAEYLIEMSLKLKEMRDNKIYLFSSYASFGEYVEKGVGIKERQAYKYIKIYEELPKEFLHSSAKIGITKLEILSSVSKEERESIIESVDLEKITVLDLKKTISQYEKKIVQLEFDLKDEKKVETFEKEIKKLEKENLNLEKTIHDLKEFEKEIVEIDNPKLVEEINQMKINLEKKENEIKGLNKELLISDSTVLKFKVKFDDFQLIVKQLYDLLNELEEEKKEKCKLAVKKVFEVFGV